jgi:hypothetical protein
MKYTIGITCWIIILSCLTGCKKDKPTTPGGPGGKPVSAYFFENTEWTGACHTLSQQYDLPCYLRFNGDTTVSVYALFYWTLGGSFQAVDSVVGKITGIDTVKGGVTTINVTIPLTGDMMVYTITNKNTIAGSTTTGSTASGYNTFSPHLQLCPAPVSSLKATSWSSKKMTGGGATDGMYAYPDLATFSFGDSSQEYTRSGAIVIYTPTDHIQILLMAYSQKGSRIYLSGFNEDKDLLIGYFGVLAPDGATMLVDARAKNDARLPNYLQTIYWYGPPGVTPIIYKQ